MPDQPAAPRPGSTEAGFYRYETMLPVVVLGLVLAISVPYCLRRHVEGQAKATVADLRALQVAMAGYKAANGGFYDSRLACLVSPGCLPDRGRLPAGLLEASLASAESRHGYRFRLVPGPPPRSIPPASSPTSVVSYCYTASPDAHYEDPPRFFAIDDTARVCVSPEPIPCVLGRLPQDCSALD